MKIKGREFMEWYDNHFPDGYFFDSQSLDGDDPIHSELDGSWMLLPDENYDTDALGYLEAECPMDNSPPKPDLHVDTAIRRWRKARDFDMVEIQVPKARLEEVRALLKANNLKIA